MIPERKGPRQPRRPRRVPALSSNAATRAMKLRAREARQDGAPRFLLRLYVTGMTATSARAVERVRKICDEHLRGLYDLEVVDIYQLPALAKNDQIIATPTLIKVLPAPLRRFIGDLSRVENVLFGMDLRARP